MGEGGFEGGSRGWRDGGVKEEVCSFQKKNKYLSILICFFFLFSTKVQGRLAPCDSAEEGKTGLIIECPFHLSIYLLQNIFLSPAMKWRK